MKYDWKFAMSETEDARFRSLAIDVRIDLEKKKFMRHEWHKVLK